MAAHIIKSDSHNQFAVNKSQSTWTVNAGVDLFVYGESAIVVKDGMNGNTINILGHLLSTGNAASGVEMNGDRNTYNIGATGEIDAYNGLSGKTTNATIVNRGDINGHANGIYSVGATHMNNMGEISGIMAVVVGANEGNPDQKVMDFTNEVINHKHGVIMGANAGIYFVGSGEQTLVNAGLIAGDMAVTTSASGSLHMVNTGRMEGNIILNSGSDVVDTRTGIIHGQIAGGGGNDVYLIGKSPVSIVEVDGAGYDTVNSNASYTLADNVEKLVGLGTGNIALFGNSSDNIIQGNKGHNNISGMGGADQLSGGRGDDHLTGGTDADTFIFYKGDGKDTVGDFENGADKIMLFNVPGADSFADLEPHIKQHGGDVWFDFGADRLVLTGMKVADIDATDFNF